MAKLICEKCGWKYNKKDAIEAFEEIVTDESYDEFFEGRNLCPDCAKEEADEWVSNCLSGYDAALIYMSSGEDEDYDFSDGGIDTSYYKDE